MLNVQKNSQKLESEAITLPCYRGLDPEPIIKKIKTLVKYRPKIRNFLFPNEF